MTIDAQNSFRDSDAFSGTIASRLRLVRGEQSRRSFAKRLSIKESTLRNYEQGASVPNADFLVTICKKMRISSRWLLLGEGAMGLAAASGSGEEPEPPERRPLSGGTTPVIGLAAGDAEGWYTPSQLALSILWPVENAGKGILAVLTAGAEMQPEGIKPGNVAICDKSLTCGPGDAVYVRRKDGRAALRRLHEMDESRFVLQSWQAPSEEGIQALRLEKAMRDDVDFIAPVSFIKVKA